MERRNFLQNTIALLAAPGIAIPALPKNNIPPEKGFLVKASETRYKEKIILNGSTPIDFKLLSTDTEDRLSVFISANNLNGFGPPLHLHHHFDEFFCVLDGNFLFQLGEEKLSFNTGDSIFVPRNVRHCFNYTGEKSGTLLVGILPGKGMENYFAEMGKLLVGKEMPDMTAMQALYKSYDSEIVGPPLK
jgi:mannose-6-phosphate isomerase-like protein (cupin superfamily)